MQQLLCLGSDGFVLFFLHPFLFFTHKCVFSLCPVFMSIPWKAGLCMKTEAAQCHRNVASLPPAAWELLVDDHNLRVWWECHLCRYWQENSVAGELELSEDWVTGECSWTSSYFISLYIPLAQSGSWANWMFCHQHLRLSDGSSVALVEYNA